MIDQEKIKALINSSPVLQPAEKGEWLALLEVMDDKQVLELERILTSGGSKLQDPGSKIQTGTAAQIPSLPQPVKPQPVLNPKPSVMPPAAQLSKLTHIVNVPRVIEPQNNKATSPINLAEKDFIKPKVKFLDRIKAMLSEKELPAHVHQAELPKPPTKAVPSITPTTAPSKIPTPPVALPKPGAPLPKTVSAPAALPPKPAGGLSFVKTTEAERNQTLLSIKEHLKEKGTDLRPATLKDAGGEFNPESAADFASLGVNTINVLALETLLKKVKPLVQKYGYFEVIFNIEKSQAYKAYINTGLKLLGGQAGTEQLPKQDFEKFADFLTKIQLS